MKRRFLLSSKLLLSKSVDTVSGLRANVPPNWFIVYLSSKQTVVRQGNLETLTFCVREEKNVILKFRGVCAQSGWFAENGTNRNHSRQKSQLRSCGGVSAPNQMPISDLASQLINLFYHSAYATDRTRVAFQYVFVIFATLERPFYPASLTSRFPCLQLLICPKKPGIWSSLSKIWVRLNNWYRSSLSSYSRW